MEALTIKEHEAYLRQVSSQIVFPDKQLNEDIEVLRKYCRTHTCFAMASIQLGIPKRLVLIKSTSSDGTALDEKDWLILCNPVIMEQIGCTEYWEACMSGLDNCALVERPYKMKIKYQTMTGQEKVQEFEGFVCTVLSHELDHLDGIFHMDRAKELYVMPSAERMEWRKLHPYKVHSKEGNFYYHERKEINREKE